MSMYFSLQNLCGFEITRPVCDMAAFFDYELAESVQAAAAGESGAIAAAAALSVRYDERQHIIEVCLVCEIGRAHV